MKKILEWTIKNNGTKLLDYGVLILFINIGLVFVLKYNPNIYELFFHLGFSIAALGGIGKALCFVYIDKSIPMVNTFPVVFNILKYISILSIFIILFFFISHSLFFFTKLFEIF